MKNKDDVKAFWGTGALAFMLALAVTVLLTFAGCGGNSGLPNGVWETFINDRTILLLTQNGRMFITEDAPNDKRGSRAAELEYSFTSGKGTISDNARYLSDAAFTLSGKTLTFKDGDDEAVFTKVSKPETSAFDGLWVGKDGEKEITAAIANGLIFLPDRSFAVRFTVNGRSASGVVEDDDKIFLSLKGDTLTVTIGEEEDDTPEVIGTFTKAAGK
jgi:hypothetical protein